jgi:protocatechuate 3,4-dioxygenase beta subunit
VYVWHCDRDGGYSLCSDGITAENYLRGVQIADDQGVVKFTSIFPAC